MFNYFKESLLVSALRRRRRPDGDQGGDAHGDAVKEKEAKRADKEERVREVQLRCATRWLAIAGLEQSWMHLDGALRAGVIASEAVHS